MEFKYQGSVYIDEWDLDEICNLCEKGYSVMGAISAVSAVWNEQDYCKVVFIKDQLIKEIKRRLAQEKIEIKD